VAKLVYACDNTHLGKEVGLDTFPPRDRPPVVIPFWTFRVMVGMAQADA
jgi:cytochrome bd-type quinol oxidase subunit 1